MDKSRRKVVLKKKKKTFIKMLTASLKMHFLYNYIPSYFLNENAVICFHEYNFFHMNYINNL